MKTITVLMLALLCMVGMTRAQSGVRIFGAQQFQLDDNIAGDQKAYISSLNGSTGIDNSGNVIPGTFPSACAILDLSSINKGLLLPRLTNAQMLGICGGAPPAGLTLYNTSTNSIFFYNGATWTPTAGAAWLIMGNALTGGTPATPNEFFGSVNNFDAVFRTNNAERARISSTGNVGIGTPTPSERLEVNGNVALSWGAPRFIYSPDATGGNITGFDLTLRASAAQFQGSASSGGNLNLIAGNTNNAGAQAGGNIILTSGRNYWNNGVNPGALHGDIIFQGGRANQTSSIFENMRINGTTGNVGIGTSNPGRTLDVDGASGTGIRTTVSAASTSNKSLEAIGNDGATGATNVGLQLTRGDLTMGRRQPGAGAAGGGGVAYSGVAGDGGTNNGPSGIADVTVNFAAQGATANGAIQNSGIFSINNQYINVNSIIIVTVLDNATPFSTCYINLGPRNVAGAGNFIFTVTRLVPPAGDGALATVKIGYVVINPDR
ncbi:MAG TPA: hypothetical protein VEW28_07595 [Candidatus Kapabacteria bacterium]|nr:hypothetical protein [Candidatus Kapabacteria bacterium]